LDNAPQFPSLEWFAVEENFVRFATPVAFHMMFEMNRLLVVQRRQEPPEQLYEEALATIAERMRKDAIPEKVVECFLRDYRDTKGEFLPKHLEWAKIIMDDNARRQERYAKRRQAEAKKGAKPH